MEIIIEKQLWVIVYSVFIGLIFGALYDIIRIIHILCGIASYSGKSITKKSGKLSYAIFFILDLIYMTSITAIYSFFIYWQMNGILRYYPMIFACVGFAIYYNTAGRVAMLFSEAIVRFLKSAVFLLVIKPVSYILKILINATRCLYIHLIEKLITAFEACILCYTSSRIKKRLKRDL